MEYINSDLLRRFAEENNGNYIERTYWHSPKAEIPFKNWKIIFDNYTEYRNSGNLTLEQIYTRVVAPIKSNDNFKFDIYRKTTFSSIPKIFGAQDVEIGNKEFDKSFIIKANNEFKIKAFLNKKELRTQIENFEKINLQISDQKGIWEEKLPEKEFELSFFVEEPICEMKKLDSIYLLFEAMLCQLEEINSIQASS
jgi:hypothetical protein